MQLECVRFHAKLREVTLKNQVEARSGNETVEAGCYAAEEISAKKFDRWSMRKFRALSSKQPPRRSKEIIVLLLFVSFLFSYEWTNSLMQMEKWITVNSHAVEI